MKDSKYQKLVDDVSEFIADINMSNHHHVTLQDVIKAFPEVKEKHLRKAYNEVI